MNKDVVKMISFM